VELISKLNGDSTFTIRGKKIMLDRDVAKALGVETKELNRNAKQSPKWIHLREKGIEEFYRFQLTENELENRRCKFSTTLPFAYTQLGCAYFGTSLNNTEACNLAVQLSITFVESKSRRLTNALDPFKIIKSEYQAGTAILKYNLSAASLLGCSPSLAKAIAVQAVTRHIPTVDFKSYLSENKSDIQDRLSNVSDIGKEIGYSAQQTNSLLKLNNLQVSKRDHKDRIFWELTDKGKEYGAYIDTGKKHSDGTPIQQLKWYHEKTIKFLLSSPNLLSNKLPRKTLAFIVKKMCNF